MVLYIAMIGLGSLLLIAGAIGCVVPAVPGPLLAYLSLIAVAVPGGFGLLPVWLLVTLGIVAVATTLLDNLLPAMSSRKAGAGKAGIWGSVIGMIVGSFFTPVGAILGAFVGALLGEVLFHRDNKHPLKAAAGVFRGTVLGIMIKLAVTGVIGWYFVRSAVRLFA